MYQENKLSMMLPVRMNSALYKLIERVSWQELKSSAQVVREAVEEALKRKGVAVPERMTWQLELARKAEQRMLEEQAKPDNSQLPPISQ